jgi:hypothetical protein
VKLCNPLGLAAYTIYQGVWMDGYRHIPSSHEVDKPISRKIGIIGGTDSSRGSGLSADKATILNLGGQPFPIISAITLQGNPSRIRIYSVPGLGFEMGLYGGGITSPN